MLYSTAVHRQSGQIQKVIADTHPNFSDLVPINNPSYWDSFEFESSILFDALLFSVCGVGLSEKTCGCPEGASSTIPIFWYDQDALIHNATATARRTVVHASYYKRANALS